MPKLGTPEILLILLVVLLLFGAKRLPDLAKSVGKSLKILKTEVKDLDDDRTSGVADATTPPTAPLTAPPAAPFSGAPPVAPPAPYAGPVTNGQPADDNDRRQV